jgi:hypothetical protein
MDLIETFPYFFLNIYFFNILRNEPNVVPPMKITDMRTCLHEDQQLTHIMKMLIMDERDSRVDIMKIMNRVCFLGFSGLLNCTNSFLPTILIYHP